MTNTYVKNAMLGVLRRISYISKPHLLAGEKSSEDHILLPHSK